MPASRLPANSVQEVDSGPWRSGIQVLLFPVISSLNLHFCLFLFRLFSVFIREKIALQTLLKLFISAQCPIYLSITRRCKALLVWAPCQQKRRYQPAVILFQRMIRTKRCLEECVYFGIEKKPTK